MEKVEFTTEDGVTIVTDWYPSEQGAWKDGVERFALLLHMMPETKESWKEFAHALNGRGVSCLAIDQRGHGESTQGLDGQALDYKEFSDERHQQKAYDVESSLLWLMDKGMLGSKLAIVGASIGANLAIHAMAANNLIPVGIALSPGVDYRGVKTDDPIKALAEGQSILLVASDDDEGSFGSVNELNELNKERTFRIIGEGLGHGTVMFERDPKLMTQCVEWIDKKV